MLAIHLAIWVTISAGRPLFGVRVGVTGPGMEDIIGPAPTPGDLACITIPGAGGISVSGLDSITVGTGTEGHMFGDADGLAHPCTGHLTDPGDGMEVIMATGQ